MAAYTLKKLLWLVVTLWLMVTLLFFLMYVLPGDVALAMLSENGEPVDPAEYQILRYELGLDRPTYVQYGDWIWKAVHGNFGKDPWTSAQVAEEIWLRLPYASSLMILAVIFTIILTIPIGIISAKKRGTFTDYSIKTLQYCFMSAPIFWVGILVLIWETRNFQWHPGAEYYPVFVSLFDDPLTALSLYWRPAIIMALAISVIGSRMLASYLRLGADNSQSKGTKLVAYAMPIISTFGLQISLLLGATVIMEPLFNLPGLGTLLISAVNAQDFPMIMGVGVFFGVVVLGVNFLVDIIRGAIDSRVRSGAVQTNLVTQLTAF